MNPENKLQAALFDMDGVIVDNRDAHIDAFVEFARRHNADFDRDRLVSCFGSTNEVLLGMLFGHELTPDEVDRYAQEKEEIYRELYKPVPTKGLPGFLKTLREAGVKTAVGSSAPRVNVDFVLEQCGLAEYFDAVACGSEITRSKPDPEVYLLAARKLGAEPSGCVVFEDAFVGVEAARRAGMKVVALATTFPREQHKDQDLLIDDFTQITLRQTQELL